MASIADAKRVQTLIREHFGGVRGVRGVGVTWTENGDAHVRVNVDRNFHGELRGIVPSEINGVKIELRRVGGMRAFTNQG